MVDDGRQKYRNTKTECDGITFDSKKESNRYAELKMLQRAGHIHSLELQPRFEIMPAVKFNGKTLRKRFYVADFSYTEGAKKIVEDVKSPITRRNPVYTLKRQLFLLQYRKQYELRET